MAEFPALPLWTDAYLADTRHLNRDQHGAYLLLLMEAWRRQDCSLPDNDEILATLACASPEEWALLKPVVMAFWTFDKRRKVWRQKRLCSERTFLDRKRVQNRDKAVYRWKHTKKQYAVAMPNACQSNAPTPTPTPTEEREERKKDNNTVLKGKNGAYAFQHGCVRLTEEHLEKWRAAFPHISVTGTLIAGEPWLARQVSWFNAAAGLLDKREREATKPPAPKPAGPRRGSMLGNRR